jgi:hypothetical protein
MKELSKESQQEVENTVGEMFEAIQRVNNFIALLKLTKRTAKAQKKEVEKWENRLLARRAAGQPEINRLWTTINDIKFRKTLKSLKISISEISKGLDRLIETGNQQPSQN